MSKSFIYLLLCVCTVFTSCISVPVSVQNPVIQAESAEAFRVLGFFIDAPAGSNNQEYSIISNKTAQVNFFFSDSEYCLRAAKNMNWQTLSGIYEQFANNPATRTFTLNGTETTITLYATTTNDKKVASWKLGEVNFTLYTPDRVPDETIFSLAPLNIPFETGN